MLVSFSKIYINFFRLPSNAYSQSNLNIFGHLLHDKVHPQLEIEDDNVFTNAGNSLGLVIKNRE